MTGNWIIYPDTGEAQALRLFCFPYSGAGPQIFFPWAEALRPSIEVAAIQLPGHGTRLHEQAHDKLSTLIPLLCEALTPHLDGPFAFFGHSLGALLCFEVALQLRRAGLPTPHHLFASGRHAPLLASRWNRPPSLGNHELVEELRRLNGTPEEILTNDELLALFLPAIRADFAISDAYVPTAEAPLDCPISAFGGINDDWVSREELECWSTHTTSSFRSQLFPGNHFFLHTAQSLLFDAISRDLSACQNVRGCTNYLVPSGCE